MNYLSTSTPLAPQELISNVDCCYRMHLRKNRIKIVDKKLACYIPIGGDSRFFMLLIVPSGLRRTIFDAYHAGGVGGHLKIKKAVTVLRLCFVWTGICKEIITWVKGCLDCIRLQHNTQISCQLVHSWPLLTPFVIISAGIWSPGETTSGTCAKCILNCVCGMSQFVVAVADQHVNASELTRAFVANVLLKFGLCLVIVVDDPSLFKVFFSSWLNH